MIAVTGLGTLRASGSADKRDLDGWCTAVVSNTRVEQVIPDQLGVDSSEGNLAGEGHGEGPWVCPTAGVEHGQDPEVNGLGVNPADQNLS